METLMILGAIGLCLLVAGGIGKHLVVILALGSIVGCASTVSNLQLATAEAVRTVEPQQVQVSNVQRRATQVQWTASTPQGTVQCWADDMVRRVVCR